MSRTFGEEQLFAAALALPAPERIRYLRRACGDDADLFSRVYSLLEASHDAALFIDEGSSHARDAVERIGPYRVLMELGEGGCGVVYLAEQTTPVRREVALKIIKPGMDTKAVIARFEGERQALATMDHPHVAKVFDGGATPTGRPYFVMELVRGVQITEYCDQSRLTVPERLALFIQVCQAIQHAHLKGIIHRDIKPSNVLVTMHDGTAIVKVIDFGIAKATQRRLSDLTALTVLDQFIGTPAYVSPEQTNPGSADIDTRADIYSLGVLLYELLTGCTPFAASDLQQDGLDRMRRRIRDEEPPTPSKRLTALDAESLTHTADRRQSTAARLIKHIQGDLSWIVMRCLEKERSRRYQTSNEVVLDLQRYLRHEPVLARPPSLAYVVRKFARRQRVMFAAGLACMFFLLFIVAFAIVTSMQARRIAAEKVRAEQQGARAETVSDFMLQIFDASQPMTSLGRVVSAREILDEAGRKIRGDLRQHPEVRAQLLEAIGRAYRRLNLHETAVPYLEDALHIRRKLPAADGTKTAVVLIELSIALRAIGDLQRADALLREGLAILHQHRTERSDTYAKLILNVGRIQFLAGNLKEARKNFEESLTLYRELSGPSSPEVGGVLSQLSGVLLWQEDLPGAERAARQALEIFTATRPAAHPERVLVESRLGEILLLQKRINEAAPIFEQTLAAQRQLYGPHSEQVARVLDSLSQIRTAQGNLAEAEQYARRALDAHEAALGAEHSGTGLYRTALAMILVKRNEFEEAEDLTRHALATFEKTLPVDHQYVASAEYVLGEALVGLRQPAQAEAVLTASMYRWERGDAPEWRAARSASALGEALYRQGRIKEAEQYLAEGYRALAANEHADREARVLAQQRVRRFYTERGQRQRLEELMLATSGDSNVPAARAN
jgi:eukaryotic-like serine/threonine-protein kinase